MLYPVFCSKTIRKSASFLHTKHFNATKITWRHAKHFNATRGICSLRFCQASYCITSQLCVVLYLYVIASQLHGLPRSGHLIIAWFTLQWTPYNCICLLHNCMCLFRNCVRPRSVAVYINFLITKLRYFLEFKNEKVLIPSHYLTEY